MRTTPICDGVKPAGQFAGAAGGLNSEIRDTTEAVMFESAKFARDNVRKTARALGKATMPVQDMRKAWTSIQPYLV